MSTLVSELPSQPAERLQATMTAVRLSFVWLGVHKTLTPEQKSHAADAFDAEGAFLSAGKKLLDTRHQAFRAVTAVRGKAIAFWRSLSLPYPEPGIRLIRQDDVQLFSQQMARFREDLAAAVDDLEQHYDELKSAAQRRLGQLFNPGDYPPSLAGLFDLTCDFPSLEPPPYLQQLSPELYRQECERVQQRFDEAVELAESAFLEELSRLVAHLTERLSGQEDGRPKIFRDSAVENFNTFFERFRALHIGSSAELEELVAHAQRVVSGVEPQLLRDNQGRRQQVASQLSGVQSALEGLLIDRPRRAILRRPR